MITLEQAVQAKEEFKNKYNLKQLNIIAIGVTKIEENYVIKINTHTHNVNIPNSINNVNIITEVTGKIKIY